MSILLIDDCRDSDEAATIARTFNDGIKMLQSQSWDELQLDHDLGEFRTGYDICKWLESHPDHRPNSVVLVTANPVGRENMSRALLAMGYVAKIKNLYFVKNP